MNLEKLFPKDLYHSYVIEGDIESIPEGLLKFLELRNEIENNSPDVLLQRYESLTINDSREIKDWHSKSGITKNKKICIIATKFINREAEQALLKIIEEPKNNSHFFIIIPDASLLLPTIISRVHVIKTEKIENINIGKDVLNFLSSGKSKRIEIISSMIKENKDEDSSAKLRSHAILFINEIEKIYHHKFKKDKNNNDIKFILIELAKSRDFLGTPGASVKMILEHLALVI